MAQNQTPEAAPEEKKASPEKGKGQEKAKSQPEAPKAPEDPTKNITPDVRKQVENELRKNASTYEKTPWQRWSNKVEGPMKTSAHVGLALLNPVAYGCVRLADATLKRTPGVKSLYAAPRKIMTDTWDSSMRVLAKGATLVPSAPFTVAHEISDKLHGLDTSKPKNIIGKAFDKVGDGIAWGLDTSKYLLGKGAEGVKFAVPAIASGIGSTLSAVGSTITMPYRGFSKVGGLTAFVGNVAYTAFLASMAHAGITAGLTVYSPVAAAGYQAYVNAALTGLRGIFGG